MITFGTSEPFGTFTGLLTQRGNGAGFTKDRAVAMDTIGNVVESNLHNQLIPMNQSLLASVAGAISVPDTIGKLYGLGILTRIVVRTSNTEETSVDLEGHNHGTNAHTDTLRQLEHEMTFKGLGAQDPTGGTATGTGDFYLNASVTTISCNHRDVLGTVGNQGGGDNFTPQIECELSFVGQVTGFTATGWDVVDIVPDPDNTEYIKTSVKLIKQGVAFEIPA